MIKEEYKYADITERTISCAMSFIKIICTGHQLNQINQCSQ